MQYPSPGAQPDPMSRVVDRLLAQLPGLHDAPALVETPSNRFPAVVGGTPASQRAQPATQDELLGVWARVLLGLTLAVMMAAWPYSRTCGLPLVGYFGAVATVMVAGAWAAVTAWKVRVGLAHIISLILMFYGTMLAAAELFPRIGYSVDRATWQCVDTTPGSSL